MPLARPWGANLDVDVAGLKGDWEGDSISTYALLHEDGELALIFNVDELLTAIGRVGNVQLERVSKLIAPSKGCFTSPEPQGISTKMKAVCISFWRF